MIRALPHSPPRRRNGGETTLEFALVAGTLMMICCGVMNLGILLWTAEAFQSAASRTARCVAIGNSACSSAAQYAVNAAASLTFSGVISTSNVWVGKNVTCASTSSSSSTGTYVVVRITSNYWGLGLLLGPLSAQTLNSTACYPVSAS